MMAFGPLNHIGENHVLGIHSNGSPCHCVGQIGRVLCLGQFSHGGLAVSTNSHRHPDNHDRLSMGIPQKEQLNLVGSFAGISIYTYPRWSGFGASVVILFLLLAKRALHFVRIAMFLT